MERDHPPTEASKRRRLTSDLDSTLDMLASPQGQPLQANGRSRDVYGYAPRPAGYSNFHQTSNLSDPSMQFPRAMPPRSQPYDNRSSLHDVRTVSPLDPFDGMTPFPPPQPDAAAVLHSSYTNQRSFHAQAESSMAPLQSNIHAQFDTPSSLASRDSQGFRAPMSFGGYQPSPHSSSVSPVQDDQAFRRSQQASFEQAFQRYEVAIKRVFDDICASQLENASSSLLNLSNWLLTSVPELDIGLTRDDEELRQERTRLWNEFNAAWLSLLQRQKDLSEGGSQEQLRPGQTTISSEFLERMGRHLVRLCDSLEQHGLVDYELGVQEEEIITILTECLDILEEREEEAEDGVSNGPAYSHVSASESTGSQ